jgi:hypothetical protein
MESIMKSGDDLVHVKCFLEEQSGAGKART